MDCLVRSPSKLQVGSSGPDVTHKLGHASICVIRSTFTPGTESHGACPSRILVIHGSMHPHSRVHMYMYMYVANGGIIQPLDRLDCALPGHSEVD